ncbi:hypothetical protein ACFQ3S_12915 [Mucilaginibacter terrae]|uniref:hypothetical protein n=1 Tax=Mucilaginibacter terrae TaxID=1955052 RepID=UPI003644CD82
MKKLKLIGLLGIILLSAFSIAVETESIQGRWELNSVFKGEPFSFLIIFRNNGKYDGFLNKKTFVSGTYRMKHDTLYISDPICNSAYEGTYKVEFYKQDSIKFHVIQDTCIGRRDGANGLVYKKVKVASK